MPPVIVAVAAAAAAYGAATAAVTAGIVLANSMGAMAIGMAAAMTVSYIGNSLIAGGGSDAPQLSMPQIDSFNRGILLNKASTTAPIPVIYGSRRIGAIRVFIETTGATNEYLHIVMVLCEGPISAINTVYLNDIASTDARYTGLVDIYKHLGADDQAADANLMAAVPAWKSNHRLRGMAYLYVRLQWSQDAFPGGLPSFTADVDGRTVFDPRDDSTGHSRNPALCVRDYVTNTRYGRGIPEAMVPDAEIIAAANYCDELVTVGGVSQARYTCDGVVNVDDNALANTQRLLSSCRGMLVFSAGLYKLIIDRPTASTFAFTEDNITGAWSISLGSKKNTFNRIRAKFFNPSRSWQEDIAPVESAALRVLDNGLILETSIDLPFTANIDTARQIATMNLNQSRQQIACRFTALIAGLRCEVGNVVTITHSTPGWAAKEFRVLEMALKNNDEVVVGAREYDATVYDFGTILAVDATPNTNLPSATDTAPPQDLQATEELYYTATGKGVQVRALISWQAPASAFVATYDVEYKASAATDWIYAASTKARSAQIPDLAPGVYDIRVRSVNTMGVASEWATSYNVSLAGLTTPPGDIADLILLPLEGQAHLKWTRSTYLDVLHGGYIKVRYANLQTGATWDGGQDIGPALAGTSTNAVLPLMQGTYMVKAVDSTGNYSVNAAMVTTNVPSIMAMNYVASQEEATGGFTGTKTNMSVDAGVLNLDAGEASGSYLFSAGIDLGGVFISRVSCDFQFSGYTIGDQFDDRNLNIDDWPAWDGEATEFSGAALYMRTTEDDPSGSPTWSTWTPFSIADCRARAFEFKVEAWTENLNYGVALTNLEVFVDMPDRTERGNSVAVPNTGLAVTYSKAFNATPAVGVTVNDAAQGDYFTLSSQSRMGFTINIFDSASNGVARSIHWLAVGYGGEL